MVVCYSKEIRSDLVCECRSNSVQHTASTKCGCTPMLILACSLVDSSRAPQKRPLDFRSPMDKVLESMGSSLVGSGTVIPEEVVPNKQTRCDDLKKLCALWLCDALMFGRGLCVSPRVLLLRFQMVSRSEDLSEMQSDHPVSELP